MVNEATRAKLVKDIAKVEESYSLTSFNPLGAGGVADYFTVVHDTVELATAVKAAIDCELPYLVVGTGQSVLFSDGGFPGLVIHNQANHYVIANDHSQMVVDSGMPLQRFITVAAAQGFGGLIHLYREGGTIGGALYANSTVNRTPIFHSVRHITLLLPPTKLKVHPTIVRYRPDWFEREDGLTKLQWMKRQAGPYPPVILNAQFQLTSVRSDELMRRIHKEAVAEQALVPEGSAFGPLFYELPQGELQEVLVKAGVNRLRVEGVYPDRYFPNYLRARGRTVRAEHIVALTELMRDHVREAFGIELQVRYEKLGAW